ncbi:hypothetical protein [Psychroflexus aestuariivivens]|uniref:hypothetical protein n=1 Tax=Psychroflexus aestuariivivens TaxID=1795040 RepID=UPI000FD940EF|nr:hypothetical protein [Psychroflexus aestuariivivens]
MSLITQIQQTLASLVQWRNDVIANSKTTEELESIEDINNDDLIRISRNGQSKKSSIENFSSIFGDQNIKGITKAVYINWNTNGNREAKVASYLNNTSEFTVEGNQLLLLKNYKNQTMYQVQDWNPEVHTWLFLKGKGTYPNSENPVSVNDLYYLGFTVKDYSNNEFDLGEIGQIPIQDFINSSNDVFSINAAAHNIFLTTRDGEDFIYLYIGSQILIGDNNQPEIDPVYQNEFFEITAQEPADEPSTGGAQSVLEEEILSNVEISEAAPAGTTFPEGMTMTEFVHAIAISTFYPDLIAPSFSLNRSGSQLRIIGSSTTFTLTFNFNRGKIKGEIVNGVWDENEEQNPRAGQATGYEIDGVETENNSLQVTKTVQQGINAFVAKVTYEDGPQPKDSVNNDYQSPLIGGTSPERSASFEGIYPLFATVNAISQGNQLPNYSMLNANNIEIQLAGESGGNKQSFSIPDAWLANRALDKVEYFNPVSGQFDTANKITDFDASSATKTIESQIIGYTKYTHNGGNRGSILIRLKF